MSPPPSSSTGSTPVFIAFIFLTFYGLGAGYLESFVNYPLWHIIGETDRWVAYHEALGPRVVVVLAIPALALSLIANVLLFVRRPPAVPAWTVAATLLLLVVSTASTIAIQIPIQMALDVAYDRAALDHLIWSSLWLRDIPGGIRAAIAAYMLRLVVSGSMPVRVATQSRSSSRSATRSAAGSVNRIVCMPAADAAATLAGTSSMKTVASARKPYVSSR